MKVCECFKLLKEGMFVKTKADGFGSLDSGGYIVGEIGKTEENCLYIFTNRKLSNTTEGRPGCYDYETDAKKKGFDVTWVVFKDNDAEIEILDELPKIKEEQADEETYSIGDYIEIGIGFTKSIYILCCAGLSCDTKRRIQLTDIYDGRGWDDAVAVDNPRKITKKEMDKMINNTFTGAYKKVKVTFRVE